MKLLHKTSKYYASAALVIFVIGSIVFFIKLKSFVDDNVQETLYADKVVIERQVNSVDSLPDKLVSVNDIRILKVNTGNSKVEIKDTLLYDDKEEHEEVPARTIKFYAKSKFYTYQITLTKSLVESDDLIEAIAIALFVLIALFLFSLYYININISKIIWSPFYHSLNKIKNYDLSAINKLEMPHSDINEFNELNKAIELMVDKIQSDYKNLKEFTENASHEIQTPLSVIKVKLELLIQTENLKEEQMLLIQSINDATNRLSRLNQSLLLLTKIENNQYQNKESINLSQILLMHVNNYKELIQAKEVSLKTDIAEGCYVKMNSSLVDILIANLITNAIKHNIQGGIICIELSDRKLIISNTGNTSIQNPLELFERFKKDKADSESLGLGLSIVKKICETEHIHINYQINQPIHKITLTF
jgi:signal transduction histidine kinase